MKTLWFRLTSIFFLAWAVVNSSFLIGKYGLDSGIYFWFCNLGLFMMAAALWMEWRSLLLAFAGTALFTQTFLLADNLWRILTGKNLLGIVEFMYHPGVFSLEFFLSHYHYFMIPTALMALCLIPKKHPDRSAFILLMTNPVLLILSYFIFPNEQNVNCIHEPCLPGLERLAFIPYPILFSLATLLLALLMTLGLERIFSLLFPFIERFQNKIVWAYAFIVLAGFVLIGVDMNYHAKLPKFSCQTPFEDSTIRISCKYTMEYSDNTMTLVYRLKNKGANPIECTTKLDMVGQFENLNDSVYMKPRQTMNIPVLLPYPSQSTKARIAASCRSLN